MIQTHSYFKKLFLLFSKFTLSCKVDFFPKKEKFYVCNGHLVDLIIVSLYFDINCIYKKEKKNS